MKKITSYSTLFALLLPTAAFGGQSLFFRSSPYPFNLTDVRFERSWLSTVNVSVMGGSTKKGYQSSSAIGNVTPDGKEKNKTNVLNIYGWQNLQFLGSNIVGNPGANIYNANLAALAQLPTNGNFGYVQPSGKFDYIEGDIYLAQNLTKGFFLDMNIPIVKTQVKLSEVPLTDESPSTGFPNVNQAEWQFLLDPANFAATLALYGLEAADYSHSGVGDIVINGGWSMNKEDVCDSIDFLDVTLKVGVNIPSGFKQNTAQAFSIAAGYNKHVGIPVSFDAAIGFVEWVTLGAHVGGTFFVNKTQELRMQTSTAQNGWIKLGLGDAKSDMGNIFEAGAYLKADHVIKGFSLSFGYLFGKQSKTTLTPTDLVKFPSAVVNNDSMLAGWNSHAISVVADYDFAKEGRRYNPNIGIFYSQPIAGKRVFRTITGGGYVGVNVAWDF
jgi:hypothetical protein